MGIVFVRCQVLQLGIVIVALTCIVTQASKHKYQMRLVLAGKAQVFCQGFGHVYFSYKTCQTGSATYAILHQNQRVLFFQFSRWWQSWE